MQTVTILQRILPHYRVPFFDGLCRELRKANIRLQVFYGQEEPGAVPQTVNISSDWAFFARNSYLSLAGRQFVYQHLPKDSELGSLVIFEQAARLLNNYPLLLRKNKGRKTAFWGHGANLQAGKGLAEKVKKRLLRQVDWWFAYTDMSRALVVDSGFDPSRVTDVQNSIDTKTFEKDLKRAGQSNDADLLLAREGITSRNFALYCGGLYANKKLDFLIQAACLVKEKVDDFELVVIGSGPDEEIVKQAAAKHDWLHYLGPKFGTERAPYFNRAQILLMPGSVGLVILDSFVAQVPLLTTDNGTHGPEIAYLQHGENGLMSSYDTGQYAQEVVRVLQSPELLSQLQRGCRKSAMKYSIEAMAAHFSAGVQACLAS